MSNDRVTVDKMAMFQLESIVQLDLLGFVNPVQRILNSSPRRNFPKYKKTTIKK